jgi:hypothetical protein
MKQPTEGGVKTMAKTTANIFYNALNEGIFIPPIKILGKEFPNIKGIACVWDSINDQYFLKWRTYKSDEMNIHQMHNKELTNDEIIAILVVLRIS